MSQLPKITQSNVHIFIPCKAAYISKRLSQEKHMTAKDSILMFYNSRTYQQLEQESTKLWQDNVKQLYADFMNEK